MGFRALRRQPVGKLVASKHPGGLRPRPQGRLADMALDFEDQNGGSMPLHRIPVLVPKVTALTIRVRPSLRAAKTQYSRPEIRTRGVFHQVISRVICTFGTFCGLTHRICVQFQITWWPSGSRVSVLDWVRNLTSHRGWRWNLTKITKTLLVTNSHYKNNINRDPDRGMKCVRLVHILGCIILAWMPTARPTEETHRGTPAMMKSRTPATLCSGYVAAKEAGLQMLADNIATTHPFVREEPCQAGRQLVAYPVPAQRLHTLQGQREKLVNQLVVHEECRKDLFTRLDETIRSEVLAQEELDQALAKQRHNTTPDPLEGSGHKDLSNLHDADYLAVMEAAKGFKANLGAAAARAKMHRDKIQEAQASSNEEPQQKKPRLAAKQPDPTAQTTTMGQSQGS